MFLILMKFTHFPIMNIEDWYLFETFKFNFHLFVLHSFLF